MKIYVVGYEFNDHKAFFVDVKKARTFFAIENLCGAGVTFETIETIDDERTLEELADRLAEVAKNQ